MSATISASSSTMAVAIRTAPDPARAELHARKARAFLIEFRYYADDILNDEDRRVLGKLEAELDASIRFLDGGGR